MFKTLKRLYTQSVPAPSPSPTPTPTSTAPPIPTPTPTPTPSPSPTPTPTPTPSPTPSPTPVPPDPAPPRTYATVQMSRQNPLNRPTAAITTSPAWGTATQRVFIGSNAYYGPVSANATYFNYWKLASTNMQFVTPYTSTSNPTYFIVKNNDTSTKTVIAYFK